RPHAVDEAAEHVRGKNSGSEEAGEHVALGTELRGRLAFLGAFVTVGCSGFVGRRLGALVVAIDRGELARTQRERVARAVAVGLLELGLLVGLLVGLRLGGGFPRRLRRGSFRRLGALGLVPFVLVRLRLAPRHFGRTTALSGLLSCRLPRFLVFVLRR